MTYKDLLVHVDNGKASPARVAAAIELARGFEAHLTGLYVQPRMAIPVYAEMHIPADILDQQEREAEARAQAAELQFRAALEQAGLPGEWRHSRGFTDRQLSLQARGADLVVLGQAEDDGLMSLDMAVDDHVLMGCGRPVLFVPCVGVSGSVGRRVMVAWDASREAARAVNDALPLLRRAEWVEVITVNPPGDPDDLPPATDICLHLARHGVRAEAAGARARDVEVGDVLLSRVADRGADLLVAGAYGHSRLRETVLGGVTRHLLAHMTVPVLMSH